MMKRAADERLSRRSILLCATTLALFTLPCAAAEMRAPVTLGDLPQNWHDDHARDVTLSTLRGHRVVMTMAYAACHRICPMTMDELKQMQRVVDARGETIQFVVIGYDAKNDNPAAWRRYRLNRGLNRDNWYFLSGSQTATKQLARQLGFPFWIYDEHVMHESRAVIFDSDGVERAVLGPRNTRWSDAL